MLKRWGKLRSKWGTNTPNGITVLSMAARPSKRTKNKASQAEVERELAKLYRMGGMDDIAKLEQRGLLSAKDVRILNNGVKTVVKEVEVNGTKNALQEIERQTGVKFK